MTNLYLKYSIPVLALIFVATGCQKKIVNKFDSESSLFFFSGANNSKGSPQIDSISYSFFLAESSVKMDTVWVDVMLTGLPSDTDRPLPIVQTNTEEANAAAAGIHYVPLDDPEMAPKLVMPANKFSVSIPIVIKRTADMDINELRLYLAITTNDYFVAGIKDRTNFLIKITAMAVKPALWDLPNSYLSIFGPWGQVKMKFIIDYVGFKDFDKVLNVDYRVYLRLKAREKLAEYEKEHGPLYETDGITRVIFP